MRRRRAIKHIDRRIFSHTARKVHRKNLIPNPMRGGFRI